MNKKLLIIIGAVVIVVVVLIIILVAKGNSGGQNEVAQNIMVIWDYNDEKRAYDPVITNYQTQKDIKIQYVQKNPSTYLEDTINAIAAGNGPDVWIVPSEMLPKIQNVLTPMPDYGFADNANKKSDIEVYEGLFPKVVAKQNIIGNKIYGVPIAIDKLRLYVNQKVLAEGISDYYRAHPKEKIDTTTINSPRTWDDIVKAVKIVTKKNGDKIDRSVIALGTSNNIPTANDILTLLMFQNGTKMTSDDLSTAQFHTQQNLFGNIDYPAKKALEFYASFANKNNENYTWNGSMGDAVRSFAEGKTAMLLEYGSAKKDIKYITPNLNFQTLDVPQIRETKNPVNLVKYDTLVVPKSSKMSGLAWRFILTATGKTFVKSYTNITKKTMIFQNTDKAVGNADTWYNPDHVKVEEIFDTIITQVNEGKSAQTALDGAAGQVTTMLGKLKQ